MTFSEYYQIWIERRRKDFPTSTVRGDEQRARDYLNPIIGNLPLDQITLSVCKKLLIRVMEPNYKPGITLSRTSRDKIKALLSAILSAAVNEPDPLIQFNPVRELRFSERRQGKKKPRYLADRVQCQQFLEAASKLGLVEHVVCSVFLYGGLRKQELVALRWKSIDWSKGILNISEKLEQCTNRILLGTKSGENISRKVPIPLELLNLLKAHKEHMQPAKEDDFIFINANKNHLTAKQVSNIVKSVSKSSGIDVSPHSLRHSYGRQFIENGGSLKALQAILGHSSSSTTDQYSDLAGKRIEGLGEIISLGQDRKS